MKFWLLTFTEYEDDYKHRYDSGVYPKEPEVFKTKEEAEARIRNKIEYYVLDRLNDDEVDEEWKKLVDTGTGKLKLDIKNNMKLMMELYEEKCSGEFIPYKFTWILSETKI